MKSILHFLLCVLLLLLLVSCNRGNTDPIETDSVESADTGSEADSITESDTESETDPAPSVIPTAEIAETSVYLFVGEKYNLTFTTTLSETASGSYPQIPWSTSSDCVTVENGTVRAQKEGYAIVSGGGATQCVVRVLADNMPVLRIDTDGASISSKETYVPCLIDLQTENSELCFEKVGAGIRLRGNSTLSRSKKPYRIKFTEKRNVLGLNEGAECRSWVLLAERYDDSFIRNASAFTFASMILTEYSSDFCYVMLELNGEKKGVYLLAEQSQIHDERIDIEEAGEESGELRSGYLFEIDASSNPPSFYLEFGDLEIYNFLGDRYTATPNDSKRTALFYTIKNDGLTTGQTKFAEKYLNGVFQIVYSATYEGISYEFDEAFRLVPSEMTCEEAIAAVIDLDSMARKYIHSEIFCNGDEHKKSYFMYVDLSEGGSGKLIFGCPWDFDTAFVHWDSVNYRETDVHYSATRNLWYVMIMNNAWFRERVIETWDSLYAQTGGYSNALSLIRSILEVYGGDFQFDLNKWGRTEDYREQIPITYDWLVARIAWLNENIARVPAKNEN
ncbi:MAG: hypothetical protein E7666_02865 [Ruminococcaceae bacterium]|nr:hypothetical protein [Oscillospiraceae bacterium]